MQAYFQFDCFSDKAENEKKYELVVTNMSISSLYRMSKTEEKKISVKFLERKRGIGKKRRRSNNMKESKWN